MSSRSPTDFSSRKTESLDGGANQSLVGSDTCVCLQPALLPAGNSDARTAAVTCMEFSAEALINAVKDYLFLYNKRHPDHKERGKKLQAWNEIGDIFGIAGTYTRERYEGEQPSSCF